MRYIENWKDRGPENAEWSSGPGCGPFATFEDLETGAPEDATWRQKPAVGNKECLNIRRLEISNVLAGGGLQAL